MEGHNAKISPCQRNDGGRGVTFKYQRSKCEVKELNHSDVVFNCGVQIQEEISVMLDEETRRAHSLDHVAEGE